MTYRDALTRLRAGADEPEDCAGRARKAMNGVVTPMKFQWRVSTVVGVRAR
ncbi:hypothetical protein IOD16_39080 [Saccharothrix sp. 6-C]|uniref:hypothetical protein n=1 Tax=Saccharothrix sp. 6-C TaxID=2781735 RepID=UPI001916D3AF|nr:hypothetical protein [Saccharothrix sp. 6-C]QQQ76887.1 hypothetical protein IOD16_39080 [Saccharothrix sp. 6-C]